MIGYYGTDNPDVRVALYYDEDAENPLMYQGVGVYLLEANTRNYLMGKYEDKYNSDIDEAAEAGDVEWATVYEPSTEQRREFAEQWLTEKNVPFYTTTINAGRDWVFTGIFYAIDEGLTVENIRAMTRPLGAWYNGEVYRIGLQKRDVYKNVLDDADVLERWNFFEYADFGTCGDIYEWDDIAGIVSDATEFTVVGDIEYARG